MHSNFPRRARMPARAAAIVLALSCAATGAFAGARYKVLASFDGADGAVPGVGLTKAPDGRMVGITTSSQIGGSGGPAVIYSVEADNTLKVLHVFAADGSEGLTFQSPLRTVALDGWIYGVATEGGAEGLGTLFRVTTDGDFEVVHSFTAAGDATGHPSGALALTQDGTLYGTTAGGVPGLPDDHGTVFGRRSDGSFFWLHRFTGGDDGASPMGGVALDHYSTLHGTTSAGGANGGGVLFSQGLDAWIFKPEHAFSCIIDGCAPRAAVAIDSNDHVFGTTSRGGSGGGMGTIFKSTGGKFFTLHTFTNADTAGRFPIGGLAFDDVTGLFWGTTSQGGSAQGGTLFKMSAKGKVTVQHAFGAAPDGSQPWCTPTVLVDGTVYGTTTAGGAGGLGTVWRLKPAK